ncbi:MAG: amino acid transporter [Chloroflexi bacterium]|nr:amino acid transporter [Chloroflexota bacterium]
MFPNAQWTPLSLSETQRIFADAPFTWGLGGGYAVEQFLGTPIRSHDDVDIVIFRDEQIAAQHYLAGWELYAADPPGTLRKWKQDEYLPFGIHDIWGYRGGAQGWEFQFMVAESEGDEWFHRRNPQIRGKRADLITEYNGWPCVRVEVQLMYKSKNGRPKDEQDFRACLPKLSAAQKGWLKAQLEILYPDGHVWIEAL